MYKINGLEHHHTDVVATLDQDSATIHSVGATTVIKARKELTTGLVAA